MAHSCRHCQKFIIAPPRASNYELNVLKIEVAIIVSAASDGCAFFDWCLSRHPGKKTEEFHNAPFLRGRMHEYGPNSRHLSLYWEAPNGEADGGVHRLYILTQVGELGRLVFNNMNAHCGDR
jgi:hypothetical protein